MTILERIARRQLLVVTGKGGVGKSSVAASLGRVLARHGRRVLLLEVDPRESLHQLLGVAPSGGEFVSVDDALHLQNLRPRTVLDALVRDRLRVEFLVQRVLSSPVYQHFAEGAPGLKEVAVLGHAVRILEGKAGEQAPTVDQVVIDAPATGHGVSMLAAPGLASDVIPDGPVGRLARELAAFVSDRERCAVIVATLAEEMPVQETIELSRQFEERLGRTPEAIVVNGLYPPVPDEVASGKPARDPALELWIRRRGVNDREIERLGANCEAPRIDLPLSPHEHGVDLVSALVASLQAGLDRPAEGP